MVSTNPLKILILAGPTASGKSALAMDLAKHLPLEIINADSRQFYCEMNIGTAKPTQSDMQNAAHHLIDVTTLDKPWDVKDFMEAADNAIQKISSQNKIPLLCGGTGLYLSRLLAGLAEIPKISAETQKKVSDIFASGGIAQAYEVLKQVDAHSAERLQPADTQRIGRALEVFFETGKPIHSYWAKPEDWRYKALCLGLAPKREILYSAINVRVQKMYAEGLKNEALTLFKKFPQNEILKKTIGYAEWQDYPHKTDHEIITNIQLSSRRFAKRQLTWFKHQLPMNWISPDDFEKNLLLIREFFRVDS